jgi:signal transduction histidine kinase
MKFTFSHRIIGAFLAIAVLSIFVGYFAFIATNNLQKVSKAIMKENVSSLKAAEELELALLNQKGLVASYFLDSNPLWLKTLEEKKKDFEVWFKRAREVALTDNEKKILRDIQALYKDYDNQRNRATRLFQTGNPADAKRILLGDMKNSIDLLYQKCEDLILANEFLIAEAEASSQGNVIRMTVLIWTTIAFTLFLGGLMGFLIARKINEQLVRSAKMASLGQLSANVAHEVRNPLTSIKMRLYSLQEGLKDSKKFKDDISVISEEIKRLERIVKNFLDFARPPELSLQLCSIDQILESISNLLEPKIHSQNIKIQKKTNSALPEVEMDKEQIRQAFLNIMLNAVEAMPHGGILEITESLIEHSDTAKSILEVQIKDTGYGIDSDLKNKLFEPFITTKEQGTGLGLFIASRIVQKHKGSVNIASHPGKGTTVIVKLPLSSNKKN